MHTYIHTYSFSMANCPLALMDKGRVRGRKNKKALRVERFWRSAKFVEAAVLPKHSFSISLR
jgi:hypothetical protein